jgi:isopenicillin-N N-acyltransferase like protein
MGAMIGLMGVNSRGVGVCVNALSTLAHARSGLPVAFVVRRLLQAASADEAATWLRAFPHATGQHYLIADAGSVRSFEASPDGVFEYRSEHERRVLHTNHPLAEGARNVAARDETNTRTRLACLVARLGTGPAGLDDIKTALSSKDDPRNPVCRTGTTGAGLVGFTTGSMVSTLSPRAAGIDTWISPGPPCMRAYVHLQRKMPA